MLLVRDKQVWCARQRLHPKAVVQCRYCFSCCRLTPFAATGNASFDITVCAKQAIQVQGLAQTSPGRDGSPQRGALAANAVSLSAEAAKHVLQSVHTFVALTQVQQVSTFSYSWLVVLMHDSRACVCFSPVGQTCMPHLQCISTVWP